MVLIQEMDVKADMGFLMALLGLVSSDTIDRSQEVTNIIAVLIINPCCTACPVRQFKILEIQHILFSSTSYEGGVQTPSTTSRSST